jgi:acylphosphatase
MKSIGALAKQVYAKEREEYYIKKTNQIKEAKMAELKFNLALTNVEKTISAIDKLKEAVINVQKEIENIEIEQEENISCETCEYYRISASRPPCSECTSPDFSEYKKAKTPPPTVEGSKPCKTCKFSSFSKSSFHCANCFFPTFSEYEKAEEKTPERPTNPPSDFKIKKIKLKSFAFQLYNGNVLIVIEKLNQKKNNNFIHLSHLETLYAILVQQTELSIPEYVGTFTKDEIKVKYNIEL